MEKIFKLKENGTNVRTELVAGLTTFMTMAYIIALNPNLLTNFAGGTPLWKRSVHGDLHSLGYRYARHGICRKQALCFGTGHGS